MSSDPPRDPQHDPLPPDWVNRILQARRRLDDLARRPQSPLDWAEFIPQLLEQAGWPGDHPLSSIEFQATRRWQHALEAAGSLGFDGRRINWRDFLSAVANTLDETLFTPESSDAPIQIAGPAESAGLTADAVWFLGATEDAWPAGGITHPLLPPEVQRDASMPHATPQLDWDLAQAITHRLLASAPEVHFSYPRQTEGTESRPSRLVAQLAEPRPLPVEWVAQPHPFPLTVAAEDCSRVPYPASSVKGGASVLTAQSQCPFKAFATARLAAQGWERAQPGLTAAQRGQLLHQVLGSVWAAPPDGIGSHTGLLGLTDRETFVSARVQQVFAAHLPPSLRDRMPARYLELEQQRLTRLVTAWLEYESGRVPFEVMKTETSRSKSVAGLTLQLRIDRLDRLNDGSVLVVDYKSGIVSPRAWDLPRPEDIQLPLYAGFALEEDEVLGGLVFAKIRPGDTALVGCVGDPTGVLFPGLKNGSSLMKNAYTAEQLEDWRDSIRQLTRDFLGGRADVDPRDYPKTCERCGLHTLCRIQEHRAALTVEDDGEDSADSAELDDE